MSLQVWLPLNGDLRNQGLADATITNNGATINSGGKIGSAYAFDGTQYITVKCAQIKNTICSSSQPFTMSCWIYLNSDETDRVIIFGNYSANPFLNWELTANCEQRVGGGGTSNFVSAYDSSIVPKTTWTHIAVTFDGTNTKFYQNGILGSTRTTAYTITSALGTDTFWLGSDARSGATRLKGRLNDFRFYDEALSPKQIKLLSQGLVLHYPLSDNSVQVLNNCFNYPTFNTSAANAAWNHWGGSGHKGHYGQNTDINYIFRKDQTYSHWISDDADATKDYLLYQSPAFDGGIRSLQCICKEENGLEINESIVYPDWNARNGGVPNGQWTSITSLGNGFYLCKCEGIQQDGSNDLVGFYVRIGYKVYFSEAYLEDDKGVCSDIFFPNNNIVYDVSGYCNNGTINGALTVSNDTPKYNTSTLFSGTQRIMTDSFTSEIKTMSAWVKTTKNKSTSQFVCADSSSKLCISFYNGTIISYYATTGYSTGSKCTLGNAYIENGWNHIVVIVTGDGTRDVYCNGVKQNPTSNDYWTPNVGFWVGARNSSQGNPFYGYISDVRAYATALSADDILELYNTPVHLTSNGALLTSGELTEV